MPKAQISLRVDHNLARRLRELSERESRPLTELTEELLNSALDERREVLGISLIDSAINRILSRHFKTLGDRLSRMLARTMLEAMTSRALTIQLVAQNLGADKARAYNQKAYGDALQNSKKRIADLEEIIQTIATSQSEETQQKTKQDTT